MSLGASSTDLAKDRPSTWARWNCSSDLAGLRAGFTWIRAVFALSKLPRVAAGILKIVTTIRTFQRWKNPRLRFDVLCQFADNQTNIKRPNICFGKIIRGSIFHKFYQSFDAILIQV